VNLAVLSGTEILYIDKVDSPRSVGVMSKIGQRNPVYCTSLGKSLLAFQNEEEQARIIAEIEFKPLTPHTITSKKEFLREMKQIRLQGYALDRREIEEDVECIAAPIRNHLGIAVAAHERCSWIGATVTVHPSVPFQARTVIYRVEDHIPL